MPKFRVKGCLKETAEDVEVIIEASSYKDAERIANQKGMLVSDVLTVEEPSQKQHDTSVLPTTPPDSKKKSKIKSIVIISIGAIFLFSCLLFTLKIGRATSVSKDSTRNATTSSSSKELTRDETSQKSEEESISQRTSNSTIKTNKTLSLGDTYSSSNISITLVHATYTRIYHLRKDSKGWFELNRDKYLSIGVSIKNISDRKIMRFKSEFNIESAFELTDDVENKIRIKKHFVDVPTDLIGNPDNTLSILFKNKDLDPSQKISSQYMAFRAPPEKTQHLELNIKLDKLFGDEKGNAKFIIPANQIKIIEPSGIGSDRQR